MAYLNRITLIGNVGRDPEERMTTGGHLRLAFSLATTKKYKGADGEPKEQTDWHTIVAWGTQADLLKRLNVRKGSPLYVEGSMHYRTWEKDDGTKGFTAEVNLDSFQLIGGKRDGETAPRPASPYAQQRAAYAQQKAAPQAQEFAQTFTDADGDDLPF